MGKQIRFIMDEYDEGLFFAYIRSSGIVFFKRNNEHPKVVTELPDKQLERGWFELYLYKEDFGEIIYAETERGCKYINAIDAPVIEFSRTIIRTSSKEITRGRLWLEMKHYDDDGNLLTKSKLLDDWYKELTKWIKCNLTHIKKIEI